jgi:glucose/arabinose dehydrogenase
LVPAGNASGRLFIVDQVGQIRILDENGDLIPESFLDLSDRIVELAPGFDERGLLGLALHPNFAANGRFFVFYTAPKDADDPEDFNAENLVSEFRVSADDPDRADAASERVLLTIDKPQFNHNGGQLAFGPDGYLYIAVGDGGGANDAGIGHTPELGNGQDKSTPLGKILRIDVDNGDPYAVPPDNLFVDEPDAIPEIWALGLRNPWRFSFDLGGQRRLFVGDAGQNLFEEVDIIERGGNYGWNVREGSHCFDTDNPGAPPATCPSVDAAGNPLVDPIIEYSHVDAAGNLFGTAVIGGYVYRGSALSELQGQYIFGDYSSGFTEPDGRLLAAVEAADGSWTMRELSVAGTANGRAGRFILGFGQDDEGEVYVLTTQVLGPTGTTGRVFKLVPPS